MTSPERSGLAFGFAAAYLVGWAALRHAFLTLPIGFGLAAIGLICTLYVIFLFVVAPRAPWGDRRFLSCLVLVAALSRLMLWDVPPETLSSDVYRYVWDGKVQLHGINPYRLAPAAEELVPLREAFHARINHPFHQTIYPPAAQLIFALAYALTGSSLLGLKLIYLAFDFMAAWWLLAILRETEASGFKNRVSGSGFPETEIGGDGVALGAERSALEEASAPRSPAPVGWWGGPEARKGAVFIYLMSPLLVIETYVGMHVDVAGMALLAGACRYVAGRAPYRGLALLVAAGLVKYIALGAAPMLILLLLRSRREAGTWRPGLDPARWGGWALLVTAAFFGPYASAGGDLFTSLVDYSLSMEFNSPVHFVFARLGGGFAPLLRSIVLLGLMGYILTSRGSAPVRIGWAIAALVLTGPVVFPWYLLYLVPLGALELTLGGLALTTLPFLSYWVLVGVQATGIWEESPWTRFVEYVPVAACLALDFWRRRCIGERK